MKRLQEEETKNKKLGKELHNIREEYLQIENFGEEDALPFEDFDVMPVEDISVW